MQLLQCLWKWKDKSRRMRIPREWPCYVATLSPNVRLLYLQNDYRLNQVWWVSLKKLDRWKRKVKITWTRNGTGPDFRPASRRYTGRSSVERSLPVDRLVRSDRLRPVPSLTLTLPNCFVILQLYVVSLGLQINFALILKQLVSV
jgi:hypothetical protein